MGFALNADQKMTVETARAVLGEHSSSARVRQAMDSQRGIDQDLWGLVARELGWCSLSIPEALGGVGLGDLDLALLVEQMGYHLACVPFFSTSVLAARTLELAADSAAGEHYLPMLAVGELSATLAWTGLGIGTQAEPVVRSSASGLELHGSLSYVLDAQTTDLLLVAARHEQGHQCLLAVSPQTAGVHIEPLRTLDQTWRFANLDFDQVSLPTEALIGEVDVSAALEKVRAMAQIMFAAELLGVAQRCLDLTVAYTAERVQFGRTIASFQAIKHRCAEMMVRVEATRSMVHGASLMAASLDNTQLAMEAAATKALAAETAFYCAQEAIQLHGGVGFTWEYDPHLYFKRAQAGSSWLGATHSLLADVAAALLDGHEELQHAS